MLLLLLLASIWQVSEGVRGSEWVPLSMAASISISLYCTVLLYLYHDTNPPIHQYQRMQANPFCLITLSLFVCLFVCLFILFPNITSFYSISTLGLVIIDLLHRVRTQFHFGTSCEIGAWEWFIIITVPPYDILYGVQLTAWLANPYFSYIPLDY